MAAAGYSMKVSVDLATNGEEKVDMCLGVKSLIAMAIKF
jgi:hypothetical protein